MLLAGYAGPPKPSRGSGLGINSSRIMLVSIQSKFGRNPNPDHGRWLIAVEQQKRPKSVSVPLASCFLHHRRQGTTSWEYCALVVEGKNVGIYSGIYATLERPMAAGSMAATSSLTEHID